MDVLDWLLDSDPAIRWQAMRDLTDAGGAEVEAERARVASDGWGARLLALQGSDGQWDGGTYRPGWVDDSRPFFDAWTATHFTLQSLREFGLDPRSERARRAIALVRANSRWDYNGELYFEGEAEPCINGTALAVGAYFGEDASLIAERLLEVHLPDGGWNCWAEDATAVSSFHSTICALEGLREWEEVRGADTAISSARRSGEEYLLERSLFRRRTTGEVADPRFLMLSDPTRWYYDILRALDYFRLEGASRDERCGETIEILRAKQRPEGWWRQENVHQGATFFDVAGQEGSPSRFITLRALRVLRWWDGD